jgi:pimeloyl-ACP methyl ester carboxylesterase
MSGWLELERDGVRLAVRDYGGEGSAVLLLHGLAGHAGEWEQTASWLTPRHRVLALEGRGHGRSERRPDDVSRAAHVADVAHAIEQLGIGPVALVGQSFGGLAALLVAAERPQLVRALVLAEASPLAPDDPAGVAAEVGGWLADWPAPFASREAAVAYFADKDWSPNAAAAWADGLERCPDGLRPRFDADVMERTLHEAVARELWEEWEQIRCPTLVVRGAAGTLPPEVARAMAERLPGARVVELNAAGHDLHLDQPAAWGEALTAFLAEAERDAAQAGA